MSTSIPIPSRLVFAATEWREQAAFLPPPEVLTDGTLGVAVVRHRSSWVRRFPTDRGDLYVKTYDYPTWRDRAGNWGKHTAPWRRSRAANEARALTWLRDHGFAAPRPLAVYEWRRLGFVRRAALLTEAFAGEPADRALAASDPVARTAIASAIGALVRALHERGFRDRNLDLRNLLVRRHGDAVIVAKIDSPRFRLVRPGDRDDRLRRADWRRLLPQLAPYGVTAEPALRSAADALQSPGQRS